MPPEPTLGIIVACSLICLLASTIVGFSGFGFALISVPLFTLFLDTRFVVPLESLMATFCVTVLSINNWRLVKDPKIIIAMLVISAGMVVGIPIGANILANFETVFLKRVLGVVVIIFAFHIFTRQHEEKALRRVEGKKRLLGTMFAFVVGIFSGIGGGMFGTSGPPLVVYVDHFAENKSVFRAQLLLLFLLNNLVRMTFYIRRGLLNADIAMFGLWMLPFVAFGLFAGSKIHIQVSERNFGRAVAGLLLVSGILLLIR
jgi:uncharacterized membrane protein YfcA